MTEYYSSTIEVQLNKCRMKNKDLREQNKALQDKLDIAVRAIKVSRSIAQVYSDLAKKDGRQDEWGGLVEHYDRALEDMK